MARWRFAVAFSCACMYSTADDKLIKFIKKIRDLMQSMQNALYIMEIWFEYKEIAEIFEHLKKRQSSTFYKVQDSSCPIDSREKNKSIKRVRTHGPQHACTRKCKCYMMLCYVILYFGICTYKR